MPQQNNLMSTNTNIQSKLFGGKWAIEKSAFNTLYSNVASSDKLTYGGLKGLIFGNPLKMKALEQSDTQDATPQEGDIGVVNISGILIKGAREEDEQLLGLTNTDRITMALDSLANDPSVSSIILNINSPGGETTGIDVLGRKIKAIDAIKPVYAWTETQAASAAYWLASQARAIGMTTSAEVGSIGVYMLLPDESAKLEKEGIKVNEIFSGKYKLLGHDFRPLAEEDKAILQADVTAEHESFKQVIRDTRPEAKEEALEGLSYQGYKAFELGLTDVVCDSIDDFVQTLNA